MYADDLALVARSAADLQNALDALREYCRKWHLHVNIKKTKIVIFDRQETGKKGEKLACSRRAMLRQHIFYYNNTIIDVVSEFKYLGIMFHESASCMAKFKYRLYESTVKHRIAAL